MLKLFPDLLQCIPPFVCFPGEGAETVPGFREQPIKDCLDNLAKDKGGDVKAAINVLKSTGEIG